MKDSPALLPGSLTLLFSFRGDCRCAHIFLARNTSFWAWMRSSGSSVEVDERLSEDERARWTRAWDGWRG